MLSRLPISLAQLKPESNSEKVKNKTRQLLYSLYCSKKLTQKNLQQFHQHYLNMEKIFMNRENVKTNGSNKFFINLLTNLIFKTQTKTLDWSI